MAAIGAEEKEIIKNKILEVFPGAFIYEKEIRVPINDRQIKIALTCAKENVEHGGNAETSVKAETPVAAAPTEVTAAEKETIEAMMARLNI